MPNEIILSCKNCGCSVIQKYNKYCGNCGRRLKIPKEFGSMDFVVKV